MKKLLLSFCLLIISLSGFAQTNVYHPFPDSAFWRVDYVYDDPWQYPYYVNNCFQYYIAGDTLINSYIHKKIFRSYVLYNVVSWTPPVNPPGPPDSGYVGALKDDSIANKTFFVFKNTTTDSLLYDYNLIVGDTMKGFISPYPSIYDMVVLSIDSVLIKGQYRKKWNFAHFNNDSTYFIEGIGSNAGLIEPLNTYAIDFKYRYLVCVKDSTGTLFTSSHSSAMGCNLIVSGTNEIDLINNCSIFPNPFTTSTTIQTSINLKSATLNIYNALGQEIKTINNISGKEITLQRDNLPEGIYFIRLREDDKIIANGKLIISE